MLRLLFTNRAFLGIFTLISSSLGYEAWRSTKYSNCEIDKYEFIQLINKGFVLQAKIDTKTANFVIKLNNIELPRKNNSGQCEDDMHAKLEGKLRDVIKPNNNVQIKLSQCYGDIRNIETTASIKVAGVELEKMLIDQGYARKKSFFFGTDWCQMLVNMNSGRR
jgi:hypothetical protein